ncbi:hypothetical protein ABKN59_002624 [Abortiporus biennis]
MSTANHSFYELISYEVDYRCRDRKNSNLVVTADRDNISISHVTTSMWEAYGATSLREEHRCVCFACNQCLCSHVSEGSVCKDPTDLYFSHKSKNEPLEAKAHEKERSGLLRKRSPKTTYLQRQLCHSRDLCGHDTGSRLSTVVHKLKVPIHFHYTRPQHTVSTWTIAPKSKMDFIIDAPCRKLARVTRLTLYCPSI